MGITIKDIAKECGVSVATVSIQHTFTADHLHTDAIVKFHYREKLHHSDLACMSYVSTTAGTYVYSRECHNTNLSCQFLLTSVIQNL